MNTQLHKRQSVGMSAGLKILRCLSASLAAQGKLGPAHDSHTSRSDTFQRGENCVCERENERETEKERERERERARETETETEMTETTEKERGMAMFHTLKTQSVLKDSS